MTAFYLRVIRQTVKGVFVCALLAVLTGIVNAGDHYAFLVGVKQYDPTQLTPLQYTE